MISIKAVAETLGVTPQTVRNLAHRGVIPGYRIGTQLRFKERDVLEYLQRQKITTNEEQEA